MLGRGKPVFVRGVWVLLSIMYFGVLCPFFIDIHIQELNLFIICQCFEHDVYNVFVKCFQERQIQSQSNQSILVHVMISRD